MLNWSYWHLAFCISSVVAMVSEELILLKTDMLEWNPEVRAFAFCVSRFNNRKKLMFVNLVASFTSLIPRDLWHLLVFGCKGSISHGNV